MARAVGPHQTTIRKRPQKPSYTKGVGVDHNICNKYLVNSQQI